MRLRGYALHGIDRDRCGRRAEEDTMLPFWRIAPTSTPTPSPSPSEIVGPDPVLVTPGFLGFAIVALLVIAVVLLVWDMQRRIRRARYRAEIDADLDAEEQAAAAVRASDTDDQVTDAADDDPRGDSEDPPRR